MMTAADYARGASAWKRLSPYEMQYHEEQYDVCYPNAHDLMLAIGRVVDGVQTIFDLGCGAGANSRRLALKYPDAEVVGFDIAPELVDMARARNTDVPNLSFRCDDVATLECCADVVVSFQLISWLSAELADRVFDQHFILSRKFVALSSLFNLADVDYEVVVSDHAASKITHHNTYSMPRLLRRHACQPFELMHDGEFQLDVSVPCSDSPRGFHTAQAADGRQMQFAGNLYMPWRHLVWGRK